MQVSLHRDTQWNWNSTYIVFPFLHGIGIYVASIWVIKLLQQCTNGLYTEDLKHDSTTIRLKLWCTGNNANYLLEHAKNHTWCGSLYCDESSLCHWSQSASVYKCRRIKWDRKSRIVSENISWDPKFFNNSFSLAVEALLEEALTNFSARNDESKLFDNTNIDPFIHSYEIKNRDNKRNI